MKENKKVYLEAVRIIAVLLVIFNHTDGSVYYTLPCNIGTYLYSLILTIFCRMAVPLFFMVSGALLLAKEESLSELFKKRIVRMITVLVTVSLLYYLFDIVRGRIEAPGAGDFLSRLAGNGIRESFWFLYTYICALLLLPFFRKAAPYLNKRLILYLVGLKAVFDFLVPLISLVTGAAFSFDPGFVSGCYYDMFLGYYLSREEADAQVHSGNRQMHVSIGKMAVLLAALVAFNGVLMYGLKQITGSYHTAALDYFVFLTAPLAFIIIKKGMMQISAESSGGKIILALGSCVFGIYLFDNFVRWQLLPAYLFLSEKTVGVLANSVYVALTFGGGFIYTWILRKIPVIRKYL